MSTIPTVERREHLVPVTWTVRSRSGTDSTTVEGYASVFDTWAQIGHFREKIARGAFSRVLRNPKEPVPLVFGHDQDKVLASTSNGTL